MRRGAAARLANRHDPEAVTAFRPACAVVGACALAAALLLPAPTVAQTEAQTRAPGNPITTTILEPVDPQAGAELPAPETALESDGETDAETDGRAGPVSAPVPGARSEASTGASTEASTGPSTGVSTGVSTTTASNTGSNTDLNAGLNTGTGTETGAPPERSAPSASPARTTQNPVSQGARAAPPTSAPQAPAAPAAPSASPAASSAQALLAGLWREAVASGETTLGFGAWLNETLGVESAGLQKPVDLPADQAGRTRAMSERWRARAGPVAVGAAGRVVTTFGAAIPTAFCAPLMVCYIELEPGEVLTNTPSMGDTVRWQVRVKSQGVDPETMVIEIKPSEDAQITNLVIPTDRRLYTINLVNDPQVHTPILSFLYPDSDERRIAQEIAARDARKAEAQAAATRKTQAAAAARAADLKRSGVPTATGAVPADRLDFGFRIEGRAPFRPVRVFADGRRTYIDLHPGYRGPLPVILAGPGEANKALNTRVTQGGTRLVADRVIADISLQHGKKRVRIRRTAR